MRATGTKLVITKIEVEQKSASGIIFTNQQDPNPSAKILSVGPSVKEKNPELEEGQTITVEWQHCVKVIRQGVTYYIADAQSVYAIEE
jgi:co-chaperonin GroES (HSP10)